MAACFEGTNVKTALIVNESATRAALVGMISRCVDFIDANKTLNEPAHIAMTVNELVQQFPAFTLEDWRLCLYMMAKESFGPYYERLKAGAVRGLLHQIRPTEAASHSDDPRERTQRRGADAAGSNEAFTARIRHRSQSNSVKGTPSRLDGRRKPPNVHRAAGDGEPTEAKHD